MRGRVDYALNEEWIVRDSLDEILEAYAADHPDHPRLSEVDKAEIREWAAEVNKTPIPERIVRLWVGGNRL